MIKSIFLRFIILGLFCIVWTTPMQAASRVQEKRSDVDYELLKIKSYKHWDLYLHEKINATSAGLLFSSRKRMA